VGASYNVNGMFADATEWIGGSVINLGGLPGSLESYASGINDIGQAVGYSGTGSFESAIEWNSGDIVYLGGLPSSQASYALSINDRGQAVGYSLFIPPPGVPEPSTWAMLLLGFAGVGFMGWRRGAKNRSSSMARRIAAVTAAYSSSVRSIVGMA
jgi:uncharacterized membrane protein